MTLLLILLLVAAGALGYRFVMIAKKDGVPAAWGSLTGLAAAVGGAIWSYWQG